MWKHVCLRTASWLLQRRDQFLEPLRRHFCDIARAPHSWVCSRRASPSVCALNPRVASACSLGTRFHGLSLSPSRSHRALCKAGDSLRLFLIRPVAETSPPHLHLRLPSFPICSWTRSPRDPGLVKSAPSGADQRAPCFLSVSIVRDSLED